MCDNPDVSARRGPVSATTVDEESRDGREYDIDTTNPTHPRERPFASLVACLAVDWYRPAVSTANTKRDDSSHVEDSRVELLEGMNIHSGEGKVYACARYEF